MIVSISGSQGQGKSTVLNTLASLGCSVVERKTSRSILAEWGLTLNEVNKYPPLTKVFQEQVIARHMDSMEALIADDQLHFMERSFADIFTYCLLAIGSFNEYNDWMQDYYTRCREAQRKYTMVVYLTGRAIVPEEDGVRSTNQFFSNLVDREILSCLKGMDDRMASTLLHIDSTDNMERVTTILDSLGHFNGK